jgi:sulfur-carrier protein
MVRVVMPSAWSGGAIEVGQGNLAEVVGEVVARDPGYARRLLTADGALATHVNYALDGDLLPRSARAATAVPDGSTVVVVPPMAGG